MRESIEALADRIQDQPHLDNAEKLELLGMLTKVSEELDPGASDEDVQPLRESLQLAAAVEPQSIPGQLEEQLLSLEATHPKTSAALGQIAHALSRMGI